LARDDKLSRDEPDYTTKYYRAHWQPLCAYFGLLGFTLLVIFSGWAAIYILSARRKLEGNDSLKSSEKLIADLIGAYSGVKCSPPDLAMLALCTDMLLQPILFFILYITYKRIHHTRIRPLRQIDEDIYLTPFRDPDQMDADQTDTDERVELRSWGDWAREIWSFVR
jgi:amino acid transporter